MAFTAIIDVLKRILEDPVPTSSHPILALAKTDKEKHDKFNAEDDYLHDESSFNPTWSKSERTAWQIQSYKKPLAAAGIRSATLNGGVPEMYRAIPTEVVCEKAREQRLRRQATQGVVALFNAVRQHQFAVEKRLDALGPVVFRKDKILKDLSTSDFLDRLSAGLAGTKPKTSKEEVPEAKPTAARKRRQDSFPMSTVSVKIQRG